MTLRMGHIMVFVVLTHTAFGAARLTGTLYALSNKASACLLYTSDAADEFRTV
ncbi:MAG: hypothetical protein QUT27_11175 [candidate division Zixibacteria bacterium]|nr:hypothetical protein [candidate division Zixibacteria bacterium]